MAGHNAGLAEILVLSRKTRKDRTRYQGLAKRCNAAWTADDS